MVQNERTIGGASGLPSRPTPELRAGLLFYVLLAFVALGILIFGPDNTFIQQDFPFP